MLVAVLVGQSNALKFYLKKGKFADKLDEVRSFTKRSLQENDRKKRRRGRKQSRGITRSKVKQDAR